MKTQETKTKLQVPPTPNSAEMFIKVAGTSILILAGAWLVLKISKQMLKELEGMGL
jgi:hypothetical protein